MWRKLAFSGKSNCPPAAWIDGHRSTELKKGRHQRKTRRERLIWEGQLSRLPWFFLARSKKPFEFGPPKRN
jgi:hypothetical protein